MAKYTYNVVVNDVDLENYHRYRYTYSRMEMQVMVSKNSFVIVYETNTLKTAEDVWNSREVEDAVRKCLLAQLVFYAHNTSFRKVLIKESHSQESTIIQEPRVFNLIPEEVMVDLSSLRDELFVSEYLMKRVKSKFESGIAALFSYIYAKSKRTEEDRFTYFWRAFNGIYASIAQESVAEGTLDASRVQCENEILKNWLRNRESQTFMVSALFNRQYAADKKDFTVSEKKIRHFFYTIRDKAAKAQWTKQDVKNALDAPGNKNENLAKLLNLQEFLCSDNPEMMQIEIEGTKKMSKSSLYGYLMTELAYVIRCDYFHASKPILLYTTLSNPEYRGLELANALLEHYLDNHIKNEVMAKINMERANE